MPFPLAIPVALSAIQALIKFRGRLDTILSLNETSKGLPFALPEAPQFHAPHIDPMIRFFTGEIGQNILVIRGLTGDWDVVRPDPRATEVQEERGRLLQAYYEACDIMPERLGPDPAMNRAVVSKGPSKEMRLAYYVVESHRLSRNPAVTRVLLAAADTLLEFGADNAGLVVSSPRTRGLVETLLREFAVERDWDDASGEVIFKTLLGAAALAALEHRGSLPDQPVLQVLFDALGDVQQEMGADFVAELVTRDGFRKLVGRLLVQASDQPGLLPDTPVLKESLVAMLRVTGEDLGGILGDPKAVAGVLEAGIAAAAGGAAGMIDKKLDDTPLLAVILKATAVEFKKAGDQRVLFRKVGNGELFVALYQASLHSVAVNPEALATQAKLKKHVAILVAGLADELAKKKLIDALSVETMRALTVRALEVAGRQPEFLAGQGEFVSKVIGATLTATAGALRDGLTDDDLVEIAGQVLQTASANLSLVEMEDHLRVVIEGLGQILANEGLSKLATGQRRKELFFVGIEAVVANPRVWQDFAEKDLVEPVVIGILGALSSDNTGLLSGAALVPAFRQTMLAAARRGNSLLDDSASAEDLEKILEAALKVAEAEMGVSMDGEILPVYLRRVVSAFLAAPFDPATRVELDNLLQKQLQGIA
jgi:hypothetical protein